MTYYVIISGGPKREKFSVEDQEVSQAEMEKLLKSVSDLVVNSVRGASLVYILTPAGEASDSALKKIGNRQAKVVTLGEFLNRILSPEQEQQFFDAFDSSFGQPKTTQSKTRHTSSPKMHSIWFGMPEKGDFSKNVLQVTPEMFQKFQERPKYIDAGYQHANIFGLYFGSDAYTYLFTPWTEDVGVLIDVTDLQPNEQKALENKDAWDQIADARNVSWEDPKLLQQVKREISSRILFLAENQSNGPLSVLAHYDKQGQIDSLVLEDNDALQKS